MYAHAGMQEHSWAETAELICTPKPTKCSCETSNNNNNNIIIRKQRMK